jgi:hypothetical protein
MLVETQPVMVAAVIRVARTFNITFVLPSERRKKTSDEFYFAEEQPQLNLPLPKQASFCSELFGRRAESGNIIK